MSTENIKTPLLVFFFVGWLSMFYAEVNSGSSPIWFITLWGWIITFELYLAHLLFYLNVAIRKQRLSLRHLYLLGSLVGLYEGPITKVLWHGYPGQTAQNFYLGFAVFEFLMLVFFWHPIFSFMIPIIVYELLSIPYLHSIGSHSWIEDSFFFTKPRLSKIFFIIIAFIGSVFLVKNANFDFGVLLLTGLISFAGLVFLSNSLLKSQNFRGISNLKLSNRWFKIVFSYLLVLYVFTFFNLEPQFIPGNTTLVLTAMIYMFILLLFFMAPKKTILKAILEPPFDFQLHIKNSWTLWLILILVFLFVSLTPIVSIIEVTLIIIYILCLCFGVVLFITNSFSIILLRIKSNPVQIS